MSVYLTASEVAERWGCSSSYVRGLARRGELIGMRLGSDWRFAVAVVEAYEQANTAPTPEPRGPVQSAPSRPSPAPAPIGGLPDDYSPVFPELWGREPAAPAAGRGRTARTKRPPSDRG